MIWEILSGFLNLFKTWNIVMTHQPISGGEREVSKHRMATDNIARVLMENDDTIIKQMQFSWRCNLHMTH